MRRIAKIIVILTVIVVAFLAVAYFVPGVKSAVDTAVGPNVTNFFNSVGASVAPYYTHYVAPWPNHAIIWVASGLIFAWIFHKGFNKVRGKFVDSADAESGRKMIMKEPISATSTPKPKPTEEKKEPEPEEKT